ncbi:MAG: class I mannose-6-phosphate isomerase [Thermomicrobium sp.]|nr:class I mannose-6-phosphate isomerase [Thermomicrobium sp.]
MRDAPLGSPLLLEPLLIERPWGDQRLARILGKPLPPSARIGESWETANEARVAAGPLAGLTVRELVERFGPELLGERGLAASQPFGDFPLLVKFIDADDVLSVQVHPDDEQARPFGQRGKTEAWHILAAEPGAELVVGLREPLPPARIRQLLAEGRLAAALERLAVHPGDTVFCPAGTLHAIGAGILLYEIQEQSDITYRFYDWDRVDAEGRRRPLHVEEGLAVLRPANRAQRLEPRAIDAWRELLVVCRYFRLERWAVRGRHELPLQPALTFHVVTCIAGSAELRADATRPVPLALGRTALVPATVTTLHVTGAATLLVASIPDWPDVSGL